MTQARPGDRHRHARRHRGSRATRRRPHRRARRAGDRRPPRARRTADPQCAWRALADAGLAMADLDAVVVGCGPGRSPGCGSAWPRPRRTGTRSASRCTACAAWTPSVSTPPGTCWWSPTPAAARCTGRATATACASTGPPSARRPTCPTDVGAVAGSPEHAALFGLPRQPAVYPTAVGSGARRRLDGADREPLVPLYLRRPDAKPQAVAPVSAVMTVTVRRADRRRRRALRRTGGAAVRRRRPVARGGVPARARSASTTTTSPPAPTTSSSATPASRGSGRTPPYEYEIHTIGVDPAYQGQGIGRQLLDRLLEFADGGRGLPGGAHRQRGGDRAVRERRLRQDRPAQALLPGQRRRRLHHAAPARGGSA